MSVNVHEAFSLDSFQDRLLFWDDFEGDQLKDEWRSTGSAGGSAIVVDAQTGGIVRITTGATDLNQYRMDWNNIRSLHVDKKVTMETRVKINDITLISFNIHLYFDGDNRFGFNDAGANILIYTEDNNVPTSANTGISYDTDYHIYRVEAFPTGELHFYYDGTEVPNSPLTTNIPDDAADFLQPYILIRTNEDVAKSMDIDYVYIRQERT